MSDSLEPKLYGCAPFSSGSTKGTPKNLCNKDFAELLAELSGVICLKTLVLLGSALELFRKFFGAVRAILTPVGPARTPGRCPGDFS